MNCLVCLAMMPLNNAEQYAALVSKSSALFSEMFNAFTILHNINGTFVPVQSEIENIAPPNRSLNFVVNTKKLETNTNLNPAVAHQ